MFQLEKKTTIQYFRIINFEIRFFVCNKLKICDQTIVNKWIIRPKSNFNASFLQKNVNITENGYSITFSVHAQCWRHILIEIDNDNKNEDKRNRGFGGARRDADDRSQIGFQHHVSIWKATAKQTK